MSDNIAGKVVVITGAGSGLGEATASLLSAQGASVALGARRVDRLKSLADELSKDGGKDKSKQSRDSDVLNRAYHSESRISSEIGSISPRVFMVWRVFRFAWTAVHSFAFFFVVMGARGSA
jgi:NADP-dependent 3-hydroxy acid dehydrogenase YdfG